MKKLTRVFQLDPMPDPVVLYCDPDDGVWYPENNHGEKNKIFIFGRGPVKLTKRWKSVTIPPLAELTAEALQPIGKEYGLNGALSMISGWGMGCLFSDQSCGLAYAKFEVANMVIFGRLYDEFTDAAHVAGEVFVAGLLSNGFSIKGSKEKGSLWYGYKDEENYGTLVGGVGLYGDVRLHPLQHVEHSVGKSFMACRLPPMFDSVGFDDMIRTLFFYVYYSPDDDKELRAMKARYVSVYDRVEHLAGTEAAKAVESIFELQKMLEV